MFRALPTKHYRKEISILSNTITPGNARTGTRIADFDAPGAISTNTQACQSGEDATCTRASEAVLAMETTTNKSEHPCSTVDVTFGRNGFAADNALRRVRSSAGMVRRNYTKETTHSGRYSVSRAPEREYKTNYSQYLSSRAKTFQQNQYIYTRIGDRNSVPGSPGASENLYSSNTIDTRCKYEISSALGNNEFTYTWTDGTENTVTFDDGYYDISDFETEIKSAMKSNGHYLVKNSTGALYYLVELNYITSLRFPQLTFRDAFAVASDYSPPDGATWSMPTASTYATITVSANFGYTLGLSAGTYPSTGATDLDGSSVTLNLMSSRIGPSYKPVYYKPSNHSFGVQGGVSSGDRITRLKYNTITNTADLTGKQLGSALGSANKYIYGISNQNPGGQTMRLKKEKVKSTPIINIAGETCCATNLRKRV
jgi:hypothetical protein